MKKVILLISILAFLSSFIVEQKDIVGKWNIDLVSLNSDTVFFKENIGSSTFYKKIVTSKGNNAQKLQKAKEGFEKMKETFINFNSDSTFEMTKFKSGRGLIDNVLDSGIYKINNDTILIIKQTDRVEEMKYIFEKSSNSITFTNNFNDNTMTIRFKKTKQSNN